MNSYPSFPQMTGSEVMENSDVVVDRAVGGQPKLRSFYDATKATIRLVHILNPTDWATLDAYYNNAANQTSPNSLVWNADGSTFIVYFARPPQKQWAEGSYNVTVDLVEA